MLTINVLYALPKTPLWRRLEAEGRLRADGERESNVEFTLPYETVMAMWRRCISAAYEPAALYERFADNVARTFARRKTHPVNAQRASWANVLMGLGLLRRIVWRIGVRGDYRRAFWRFALARLRSGDLETLIHVAVVSHHLIQFTRDCLGGVGESSFYAPAPATDTRAGSVQPDAGTRSAPRLPLVSAPSGESYGLGELRARTSHTATR